MGDSSFIRGVLVAQEGCSPDQMHAYQTEAEKIMQANPAVRSTFTMSGNCCVPRLEPGLPLAFLKPRQSVPPIEQVAGQLMGGIASTIPGALSRSSSRTRYSRSLPARPRTRRASSPTRSLASIPKRCTTPPAS